MSYGVRYRCEWTSPMREQREYIIEILQKDYEGVVDSIHPTGDVLTVTQGQMDANELDAIKASEASLSLLCVKNGDPYISLFTTDAMEYKLRIRRRVHELSKERWVHEWEGYISAGTYAQEYKNPPYRVSLRAVDGLAILKDIPYLDEDGQPFTLQSSVAEIIAYIVSRISTMPVTYPWPLCTVDPSGNTDTQNIIGIDQPSLYSSFSNETPSCYDVLDAVLKSLQLQLFQSYGAWVVRPIASLATSRRPQDDTMVNKGGQVISLYDDSSSGLGVSTSATLSLLAPYKSLKINRPDYEDVVSSAKSMLKPNRWRKIWATNDVAKYSCPDMLRLQAFQPTEMRRSKHYYGQAYYFDDVVESSRSISISVNIEAYNLTNTTQTLSVGLFAVNAQSMGFGDWLNITVDDDIIVNDNVAGWNASASTWQILNRGDVEFDSLRDFFQEISMSPSQRYIHFEQPCKVSQMTSTSINVKASFIPSIAPNVRMILVLAGPQGTPLSAIELREPTITFARDIPIVDDVFPTEVEISQRGLENITFSQHFADSWVTPAPGRALIAPLLLMGTKSELRGCVTPRCRALILDSVVESIESLRGRIARQIDGELFIDTAIDLNAIFEDRDGRLFYTNYIRRHLRRGVYEVQLREFPRISNSEKATVYYDRDISSIVGLDTSAYFLTVGERNLMRFDAECGVFNKVWQSSNGTYPLTLNAGQMCASVIAFDGAYYELRAYDSRGNLLSQIENLNALTNVSLTSGLLDGFARSAMYDANVNTWVLIGGDDTVTYLTLISRDGEVLANTIYTTGNYRNVTTSAIIPNGFVCTTQQVGEALINAWWHSYSHHLDATLHALGAYQRVVAANDIYIVIENYSKGLLSLFRRQDTSLGYDSNALYEVRSSSARFITMNNALVVFRMLSSDGSDAYGAIIYDGRTGRTISLSTPFSISTTLLWVSGDTIYGAWPHNSGYGISSKQIKIGDGEGYINYITADDYRYITADDKVYLTIK